jgi:DNA-binding winged helix-turn-helix (wHTH) protein
MLAERSDFALGSAIISPSSRAIEGPGGQICVEPRVMQVLLALADSDGRVVTRDTLFRRCWGNALVGDDSLNRVISEIRRIGRTIAADSFRLETIPRTGYRLTAGTAPADLSLAGAPGAERTASVFQGRRRFILGAGFALAAAGGAVWVGRPDPHDAHVADLIAQSDQAFRSGSPDSDAQGVGFLEEAVRIQPENARTWGKLALARGRVAEYAPPDQIARATAGVQDAARRAMGLDPRQADAHAALALLPPYFGDWLAAERRMDAVLAIDPEHLPTRDARAFLLVGVGRTREGAEDRLVFAARDPLDATHQYRLIYAHWILGRIGDADRVADRALQLWPKHPGIWFGRLWTLAFTGRAGRALAHLNDAAGRPDLPPWMIATLGNSLAALESRRTENVGRAVEALLADVSRSPSNAINALLLLSGLGQIDRAFDVANAYLLEQGPLLAAVRWRSGQVSVNDQRRRKTHMLFVPVTAPMRADPRFAPLVQQIGLAGYWKQAGVIPDYLQSR